MSFTDPPGAPPATVPIPSRLKDNQVAFDQKTDAYLNWQDTFRNWLGSFLGWVSGFTQELAIAQQAVEGGKIAAQVAAAAAETSAASAAVIAGAVRWQVGDYAQGAAVWSPTSLLTYRRKPAGVTHSATDPVLDSAGWRTTGSATSLPQQRLTTAGPHQLAVGIHYLIEHALAECLMPTPADATEGDALRVSNKSGANTPILRRNGGTFDGTDDDMELDDPAADYVFTMTVLKGWI